MPTNLTLYYLITILAPVTNIFTVLIILISLFRCLFSSSYAFTLFKKKIKIVPFIEYDILIVFINYGTFLIRLISIFNSSIRSAFNILFDLPYLININLFTISVFFISVFFIVLFFRLFFTGSSLTRNFISPLFLRNLLTSSTRLLSYPFFFSCLGDGVVTSLTNIAGIIIKRGIRMDSIFTTKILISP